MAWLDNGCTREHAREVTSDSRDLVVLRCVGSWFQGDMVSSGSLPARGIKLSTTLDATWALSWHADVEMSMAAGRAAHERAARRGAKDYQRHSRPCHDEPTISEAKASRGQPHGGCR